MTSLSQGMCSTTVIQTLSSSMISLKIEFARTNVAPQKDKHVLQMSHLKAASNTNYFGLSCLNFEELWVFESNLSEVLQNTRHRTDEANVFSIRPYDFTQNNFS